MADHRVGVNGIVQIDPNEVLGIERDEGVVTGASVLLWPGRWRIALREGVGGGGGGPVAWADVANKPTSFPPASHRHDASEIDNLPTGSGGSTAWADITGKPAVIAAGADAAAARTAIGAGTSSLVIGTTGTTAAAGNRQATETATGMVELATTAEAVTGTDPARVVTPVGLKAVADTKAPIRTTPTVVAGTAYTLTAGDENTGIRTTSASAVTVTVPDTLPVGYVAPILVDGAGMVTVVAGSGVTLVSAEAPVSRKTGSALAVQIVASGRAWVVGDFA